MYRKLFRAHASQRPDAARRLWLRGLLDATWAELIERGYDAFTIDAAAARAERCSIGAGPVSKSSCMRRCYTS
jgi:hypothetical protein